MYAAMSGLTAFGGFKQLLERSKLITADSWSRLLFLSLAWVVSPPAGQSKRRYFAG
jgi:hypothetical protein